MVLSGVFISGFYCKYKRFDQEISKHKNTNKISLTEYESPLVNNHDL